MSSGSLLSWSWLPLLRCPLAFLYCRSSCSSLFVSVAVRALVVVTGCSSPAPISWTTMSAWRGSGPEVKPHPGLHRTNRLSTRSSFFKPASSPIGSRLIFQCVAGPFQIHSRSVRVRCMKSHPAMNKYTRIPALADKQECMVRFPQGWYQMR